MYLLGHKLWSPVVRSSPLTFQIGDQLYRPLSTSRLHRHVKSSGTNIDFSDGKKAFRNKSSWELLKSYLIYSMFKSNFIVERNLQLLKLGQRVLGRRLFSSLMKATVYGQFAGGEDKESIRPVLARFRSDGVRAMLTYNVEEDEGTDSKGAVMDQYDNNLKPILDSIEVAADNAVDNDNCTATKLTGVVPTPFLLRLSESLVGSERVFKLLADKPSLLEGKINADSFLRGMEKLKITSSDTLWRELTSQSNSSELNIIQWKKYFHFSNLYKTLSTANSSKQQPLLPVMSDNEKDQMTSVIRRVETLAQCAQDRGVRLMVDAEQTYYQPAIRYITVDILMSKYNLSSPVIYNTQQCYLKATENSICLDLLAADVNKFHYGVKLVRGAYMEQERHLSIEKGYEDPIWSTKTETDNNYYKLLEMLLSRVRNGRVNIMVATHNEDTIKFAVDKITELGLDPTDGSVVFGQVFGMADHLALSLGSTGYLAYKCIPYGPVDEVLPYLSRRANENRGMLAGPVRERKILAKEFKRRMRERS